MQISWHAGVFHLLYDVDVPLQDMDIGVAEAGPVQLPPAEQVVTQHIVLSQAVHDTLQEHAVFLRQQGRLGSCVGFMDFTLVSQQIVLSHAVHDTLQEHAVFLRQQGRVFFFFYGSYITAKGLVICWSVHQLSSSFVPCRPV